MDYELLVCSQKSQESYSIYFREALEKSFKIESVYKKYSDYITISCNYLSVNIDTDELVGLDVIEEEFGFNANISIRIQLFKNTVNEGLKLLFTLLRFFIDDSNENLLLLENGSKVILERKDNDIYTCVHKDDETSYPFGLLEREVREV